MSTELKVCTECEKYAISHCPYCFKLVHQSFDWEGSCGLSHEAKCEGARLSREPVKIKQIILKPTMPIYDTADIDVSRNGNGKHKTKAKSNKRGSR